MKAPHIIPLDSRLSNAEVGCLVDSPLFDSDQEDLLLTSDQWVVLLARRKAAGRPLHFVEAGGC